MIGDNEFEVFGKEVLHMPTRRIVNQLCSRAKSRLLDLRKSSKPI